MTSLPRLSEQDLCKPWRRKFKTWRDLLSFGWCWVRDGGTPPVGYGWVAHRGCRFANVNKGVLCALKPLDKIFGWLWGGHGEPLHITRDLYRKHGIWHVAVSDDGRRVTIIKTNLEHVIVDLSVPLWEPYRGPGAPKDLAEESQ